MTNSISRRDFLKIGVFTLGSAIAGSSLSACGAPTPAPQAASGSNKIVFWQPVDNHYAAFKYFTTKVPDLQKKRAGIQVELIQYPFVGFEAKFLAAFAGRENAPDIFVGLDRKSVV